MPKRSYSVNETINEMKQLRAEYAAEYNELHKLENAPSYVNRMHSKTKDFVLDDARLGEFTRLYESGMAMNRIAEELNISRTAALRLSHRIGLNKGRTSDSGVIGTLTLIKKGQLELKALLNRDFATYEVLTDTPVGKEFDGWAEIEIRRRQLNISRRKLAQVMGRSTQMYRLLNGEVRPHRKTVLKMAVLLDIDVFKWAVCSKDVRNALSFDSMA